MRLSVLCGRFASATRGEDGMKCKALFVGVDEYDDPQIRNLRFSRLDAHSLNDLFADIGYDVKYLSNPTKADVFAAVRERTSGLAAGDLFFFYFAGHGFTQGGHDLLFCRDDIYDDLRFDEAGLKFEKLRLRTESNGAAYDRVFILDACRSDFLTGKRGIATYARDLAPAKDLARDVPKTGSFAVLRSCSPYQYALEVESRQHGLFTSALIDVMRTARREGTCLAFDEAFGDTVAKRMASIASDEHLTAEQTPDFAKSAGCTAHVLIEGRLAPVGKSESNSTIYVSCPKCGQYNAITDTFKCRVCGMNHLCSSHYDKGHACCDACAAKFLANPNPTVEDPIVVKLSEPAPFDETTITLPGGVPMTFCWCPATSSGAWMKLSGGDDFFWMGSPASEDGREYDEIRHRVTLTKGFWMGRHEVSQRQWESVMGSNPSFFKGQNRPVEQVSYDDCQAFIRKINIGRCEMFSLPTEAQWEYACRAGTTTPFNFGSILNGDRANCDGTEPYGTTSEGRFRIETSPVGSYSPNAWGFYDMHGNVGEWCQDWYGDDMGDVINPIGPASGSYRIIRGGGYCDDARNCRSAFRDMQVPGFCDDSVGLRLCCCSVVLED